MLKSNIKTRQDRPKKLAPNNRFPLGMAPNRPELYRRLFFKGLAATTAGGMCFPSLITEEKKKTSVPKRYLFVLEGNGLPPSEVHPRNLKFRERAKRSKGSIQSLDAQYFPRALEPVSEYADRMLVFQGFSGSICGGGHSSDFGALGCYNARKGKAILGPSIDYELGRRNSTVFKNIVLGISDRPDDIIFNCSASGVDQKIATICNPVTAYQRLFGAIGDKSSVEVDRSILEYVMQDITQLQNQIGSVEKEKLSNYYKAYQKINLRNEQIALLHQDVLKDVPKMGSKYQSKDPVDRLDAHFEMATASLMTGLTNVATIASGVGHGHFAILFEKLGVKLGKHPIGHGRPGGYKDAVEASERIRAYHFELIARTMKKLESIPEGDGTMLDNTVIIYTSDAANAHHTSCAEWPFVVLGGNPHLKLDGRYITYANIESKEHKTINTLYNTLLYSAGISEDEFGHRISGLAQGVQEGPLAEMLV